ncbi:hypothetical protein [Mesorhizobium sp. IMUNJ 23232]|uniref:hypothetical protein n=1 Tax=Mesorhizobium sp. IMUNJ 23232 TaxID=3376064 RepID=UPI0037AAE209
MATNGDDIINGTSDAETIDGLGGNDTIDAKTRPTAPGSGIDVVDGNTGIDTLVVNCSAETQSVSLGTGSSPTFTVRSTSGNFYVDAYNMEKVKFTGGSGNDSIDTGERGGTVAGGGGIDHWLANLGGLFTGVTFALGTTTSIAAAGLTSISTIERISLATGAGDDIITGGAQADTINTGDGDDTVNARTRPTGGGPIDVVDGGADTDTLIVSAAAETQAMQLFSGSSPTFAVRSTSGNFYVDAYNMEIIKIATGSGNDTIDTGDHGGTVNGNGGTDHWTANLGALTTGVAFTLGTTTSIAAAGLTSIANLERISLTTGSGNDVITSGAEADTINTGNGDDTINARTRPTGGGPIDVVDGGGGSDTLIVSAAAETQAMQLFTGGSPTFAVRSTSGNFYVDAYNMEIIKIATGAGADSINTGNHGGTVDGNGGIDHWLADLGALTTGVAFTLGTTTEITAAGLTSIRDIERISLTTGGGNDTITGGAQADTINTGIGNDVVNAMTRPTGGGPIDVVDGGAGTDLLVVDTSAETGAVQVFAGSSPSFAVRSASGNFYVDAYSMEKLKFTGGSGVDTVTGKANADSITTNAGNDILSGADGNDVLSSGLGNDQLTGGRGADKITSGDGADDFFYNLVTDSSVFNNAMDTIVDFTSGLDDINLSAIDANNLGSDGNQAFVLIGSAAFHNIAGELRSVGGLIEGDVNGDGTADIRVLFSNGATALAADIIL